MEEEKTRYFSVQLIDLYPFSLDYVGSRASGNDIPEPVIRRTALGTRRS